VIDLGIARSINTQTPRGVRQGKVSSAILNSYLKILRLSSITCVPVILFIRLPYTTYTLVALIDHGQSYGYLNWTQSGTNLRDTEPDLVQESWGHYQARKPYVRRATWPLPPFWRAYTFGYVHAVLAKVVDWWSRG
jgi:hypothetical protein